MVGYRSYGSQKASVILETPQHPSSIGRVTACLRHRPNKAPTPISDLLPRDSPPRDFISSDSSLRDTAPREKASRYPEELVSQRRSGRHRIALVQLKFDKKYGYTMFKGNCYRMI